MAGAEQDALAALRAAGAERFDAAGLHYLQVLAERAAAHEGNTRRLLDARLSQALDAFRQRFARARREADELAARHAGESPQIKAELQAFIDRGDFSGLRRFIATRSSSQQQASLRELVRSLERVPEGAATSDEPRGSRPELKTIRRFRSTLSKLSVHNQVAQALAKAPKNAGPINSHALVLRSLALMRDISPDYLNRFISYADTLLRLDEPEKEKPEAPKKRQGTRAAKK